MIDDPATLADLEPLRELQAAAMRALGAGFYTPAEIEAAVRHVCVPDGGLIERRGFLPPLPLRRDRP